MKVRGTIGHLVLSSEPTDTKPDPDILEARMRGSQEREEVNKMTVDRARLAF